MLIVSTVSATGQSFNLYKDTTNGFSIYIPAGWKYGVIKSQPTIKLIAYSTDDTSKYNYNVNVIETPNATLETSSSKLIESLSSTKGFRLLDSGRVMINERTFNWLIESHPNENNQEILMHNLDFITCDKGKTYILTMVAFSKNFPQIYDTYSKIANTFRLLN